MERKVWEASSFRNKNGPKVLGSNTSDRLEYQYVFKQTDLMGALPAGRTVLNA